MKKIRKILLYVLAFLIVVPVLAITWYNNFPWGEPFWVEESPDHRFTVSAYVNIEPWRMFFSTMPGQGGASNSPVVVVLRDKQTGKSLGRVHVDALVLIDRDGIRWYEDVVRLTAGARIRYPKIYVTQAQPQ